MLSVFVFRIFDAGIMFDVGESFGVPPLIISKPGGIAIMIVTPECRALALSVRFPPASSTAQR